MRSIRITRLRILPTKGVFSLAFAIGVGLLFGAFMAISDAYLFQAAVPTSQQELISSSTAAQRIVYFARGAIIDELEFRLILKTAMVWLLATFFGTPRRWFYWLAILTIALVAYPVSHLAYLATLNPTAWTVLRELALHGSAGVLWGYLYWRHGLIAAMAGHVSAHVSLEPLLAVSG
jgi:hypothetical protein